MTAFVDVHCHPPVAGFLEGPIAPYLDGLRAYAATPLEPMRASELADLYRSRDGKAVLLGWDSESVTGLPPFGQREVADLVATAPDVFIGFGAVDPSKGAAAVGQVHAAAHLGLKGLSFHPAAEAVAPTSRHAYPVWETAADHRMIVTIHTGFTRLGAGMPGGGGIRLDPARPAHVDSVAAEFPALRIVMAHTSTLWFEEALAVATHKPNVYLDLSGQRPSTFPDDVLELIAGPLADRMLFGSDTPFNSLDEWLKEWHDLGLSDDVTDRVLRRNAATLLDLEI